MEITIKINCDNSAFENQGGLEVARILKKEAGYFLNVPDLKNIDVNGNPIMDVNGNRVGTIEFS